METTRQCKCGAVLEPRRVCLDRRAKRYYVEMVCPNGWADVEHGEVAVAANMACEACDYRTAVVYDAACHSYALGRSHGMVVDR